MEQFKNFSTHNVSNEEIINSLKKDPNSKAIIKELNIQEDELVEYYQIISSYLKDVEGCKNCTNKNSCNHSTKGYQYRLKRDEDDGRLIDYLNVCDKYKEHYKMDDNLVYTTFDRNELLDESQQSFFIDNCQNFFSESFAKKIIMLLKNIPITGAFQTIKKTDIRIRLIKSLACILLLKGYKVAIVKMSDMLKNIKANFGNNEAMDIFNEVCNSEILIIDGLGNEAVSTWSRDEILLSLLDNRLQQRKPTIICSEHDLDDLKKLYSLSYKEDVKAEQIIDKLKEISE